MSGTTEGSAELGALSAEPQGAAQGASASAAGTTGAAGPAGTAAQKRAVIGAPEFLIRRGSPSPEEAAAAIAAVYTQRSVA